MTQPIKTKPTDDGGSAFPHGEIIAEQHDSAGNFSGNILHHESAGMSLRDWFAGMALQGIIAGSGSAVLDDNGSSIGNVDDSIQNAIINGPGSSDPNSNSIASGWAWIAYCVADAMLAARKVKP
jgi:hypothetical protein